MSRIKSLTLNSRHFLLSFLMLLAFVFVFLITASQTGLLDSGFRYFIDDHQILVMQKDLSNTGLWETIKTWINYDRTLSRFRPFFQIQVVVLTQILGSNSFLWFLYISLLGAFTAFFLFSFGRILNFSVPIALIFSIATLLGNQSEIWIRPMIPDSQGMFYLSLTLFFLGLSSQNSKYSKPNNILAFVSVLAMSLCKESYIIFIPTLILLKIWLDSYFHKYALWKSVKLNSILIGFLSIMLFLEITYIFFFLGIQGTGYAGVDQKSFNLSYILRTLNDLVFQSYGFLILIGIGLIVILSRLKQESLINPLQQLAPFIIFFFTALVPQTLLYAKSGITAAFYLFPFITVASLLLCKILFLINSYAKWLGFLSITCISIILINQLSPTWAMYSQQAKDSKSMNLLLNQIELCSENSSPTLVVVNPKVRYEVADALQRVLRNLKRRENLFVVTYGLDGSMFYSNTLVEAEKNWSFLDSKQVLAMYRNKTLLDVKNKKSIQTIIIFDGLDDDFLASNDEWFSPQEYKTTMFDISFSPAMLYCKQ